VHSEDVERAWGEWVGRNRPATPELRAQQDRDPWHRAQLEVIRSMTQVYEDAMRYEDIDHRVRRRVLNRVLYGDPTGLEDIHRKELELLLESAILRTPPRPIYFNPYSFPFHPDEPFKMGEQE
jgi:hypothetical protein